MVIENNINKKTTKAPLKIVYFSKRNGKRKLFFLPIFTKKRESYIIFSKRTIVISKILKNHIKPSDILNNPTKNGIIKIISKHRKDLENIIDVIKIKELKIISKIDNVKKNSLKKDHKNTLFSSMIFSFAKMSEINFPNIDEHLHLFRIISKILIEKIKEKEIIKSKPNYFSKYFVVFSVIHDIGKISIPNRLLYSHDNLSKDEFEIYKTHISFGVDMIKDLSNDWKLKDKKILDIAKNIIKDHHENYDGSGYPNSLKEKEITIEGRIISIIDNYIKYISKDKKQEVLHKNAINHIIQNRSKKFDPEIVDIFVSLQDEIFKSISSI